MHLCLKYQSPNTFGSKDIVQVKDFQNKVKVQDQGHKVKSLGTQRKVSSSCRYISKIKPLTYLVQNILPRFSKLG
jgi:hypothetical protein